LESALKTHDGFAYRNTFPVISLISSMAYATNGDFDEALDLQEKFAEDMLGVIDSIPVARHIKGGIHYAFGQNEEEDDAMKAASRASGVVVRSALGFSVKGPVGAAAGAGLGGGMMDGITSGKQRRNLLDLILLI
jgi:hypothetical protein